MFEKNRNEPIHLHSNRGSSGISVTNKPEVTPDQQRDMGPISKEPGQQFTANQKEPLGLPSVEILSV